MGSETAIVKYNAGNISSVIHAMERLGEKWILTDDADQLRAAKRVIFPGVGEAATTMQYLREHGLDTVIKELKQPVLGICLGQQLMCSHSEEGDAQCLGIFDVPVLKFNPKPGTLKVPHMGWNTLDNYRGEIFRGFSVPEYVYFVHSYYVPVTRWTAAETFYIVPFSAALHRDNFYATQFHPEKSGSVGERILANFLKL